MAYQDSSFEPGKLFVGGISWDTTPDSMKEYFSQFGAVSDCVVMKDPATGRPRGFGFVTFEDPLVVDKVLDSKPHMLDNKSIDPKLATVKGQSKQPLENTKVFIGGLSFDTEAEGISQFFSKMGCTVKEVDMKLDDNKKKRGFAFVDLGSHEDLVRVCQARHYQLDGKTVEVKVAEPKNTSKGAIRQNDTGYPNVQSPYNQTMGYGFGNEMGNSRFTGMAGAQYNTAGAGYSAYAQQYSNSYGDYGAGYGQHSSSAPMFQNFTSAGYGGRGYGQQQMGGYSQESGYPQSRNGFPSNPGTDSYSTGGSNYSYGYSDQQAVGGGQSYRGVGSSASSGSQPRGGTASYGQPYGAH